MTGAKCCVTDCNNSWRTKNCKLFKFPGPIRYPERRKKWIAAIRSANPDGINWSPKLFDAVCSDHFVGKCPSIISNSPSYAPTVFSKIYHKMEVNDEVDDSVKNSSDGSSWNPSKNDRICSDHLVGKCKSDDSSNRNYVPTIFPDTQKKKQEGNAQSVLNRPKKNPEKMGNSILNNPSTVSNGKKSLPSKAIIKDICNKQNIQRSVIAPYKPITPDKRVYIRVDEDPLIKDASLLNKIITVGQQNVQPLPFVNQNQLRVIQETLGQGKQVLINNQREISKINIESNVRFAKQPIPNFKISSIKESPVEVPSKDTQSKNIIKLCKILKFPNQKIIKVIKRKPNTSKTQKISEVQNSPISKLVHSSQLINQDLVNLINRDAFHDLIKSKSSSPKIIEDIQWTNTENSSIESSCDISKNMADAICQVNLPGYSKNDDNTFICNRYISNSTCDVEIQNTLNKIDKFILVPTYQLTPPVLQAPLETPKSVVAQNYTEPKENNFLFNEKYFTGISSISSDIQLLDFAGVNMNNFWFLLKKLSDLEKARISKINRLLITLMKLKTGVSYSVIGTIFHLHRTTASRVFITTLKELVEGTKDLVSWPSLQSTEMKNNDVVVDMEKKRLSATFLMGVAPNGHIYLKSTKISDEIDLDSVSNTFDLEKGIISLADKGPVEMKDKIFNAAKQMATLLDNDDNKEISNEDKKYAKGKKKRSPAGQIIQKLKTYNILNKVPESLQDYVDDILQICCVLINLQSSSPVENQQEPVT